MPSIQCSYCGYRIILPATGRLCPSCGKVLSPKTAQGTVSIEEEEPSVSNSYTYQDAAFSSSASSRPMLSSPFGSDSASDNYGGAYSTHTFKTDRIVDDVPPVARQAQGMMSEVRTAGFLSRLMAPAPALRGVLVHQSAQQIENTSPDLLAIFFREIMNIIWPAPGSAQGNGRRKTITSVRIRLDDGRQREARLDGDFLLGSVALGDEISLWGRKRRGTLVVRRAYNHTTEAKITMRGHRDAAVGAFLLLFALVGVIVVSVIQGWLVFYPHFALKIP